MYFCGRSSKAEPIRVMVSRLPTGCGVPDLVIDRAKGNRGRTGRNEDITIRVSRSLSERKRFRRKRKSKTKRNTTKWIWRSFHYLTR